MIKEENIPLLLPTKHFDFNHFDINKIVVNYFSLFFIMNTLAEKLLFLF
jgi:hypothetical protein